jgi:DNA invertase Pin-like site-specific DNA recombinase
MGRRRKRADVSLVVTYRRVSTEEQGESGAGLDAQESRLTAEIAVRGWTRVADFPEVASGKLGWNLVMLEPAVDLSTPHGEMMANIMASVAQWERRIIGQRTSEALRALQANGVTLGRPSGVPEHVVAFIRHGRGYGRSYRDIADALNRRGEPTGQGGVKWHPSSVRAVELSQAALSPAHDLAKYLAEGA